MIEYNDTVFQYIKEFKNQYIDNDNAYAIVPGTKRIRCYAIFVQDGPKNVILKKGSIIRTLGDFRNTRSIVYRLNRRMEINSDILKTTDGIFEVVLNDFNCTSKTEAVALSALVSTVSSYCFKLKHENKLIIADKSKETDSLSESAKVEASNIAEEIYDNKRKKELEEQERMSKDLTYNYEYAEEFKGGPLEYNNKKAEIGMDMLNNKYTLYVIGMSRQGKTYICKHIAEKYSGKDLGELAKQTVCLENMLWVNSHMNQDKFMELFAKFCTHNCNNDKCVVVFNEAAKESFMNLVPFWESMDKDGKKFKDFVSEGLNFEYKGMSIQIPKNLRIIANIASEQHSKQMEARFGVCLDLDDITLEDVKDIAKYTGIDKKYIEILIKFQNKLVEEWGDTKRFIVPYKLRHETVEELSKYINKYINKVIGRDFEEMKRVLINYIDELKTGGKDAIKK